MDLMKPASCKAKLYCVFSVMRWMPADGSSSFEYITSLLMWSDKDVIYYSRYYSSLNFFLCEWPVANWTWLDCLRADCLLERMCQMQTFLENASLKLSARTEEEATNSHYLKFRPEYLLKMCSSYRIYINCITLTHLLSEIQKIQMVSIDFPQGLQIIQTGSIMKLFVYMSVKIIMGHTVFQTCLYSF